MLGQQTSELSWGNRYMVILFGTVLCDANINLHTLVPKLGRPFVTRLLFCLQRDIEGTKSLRLIKGFIFVLFRTELLYSCSPLPRGGILL